MVPPYNYVQLSSASISYSIEFYVSFHTWHNGIEERNGNVIFAFIQLYRIISLA